MILLYHHFDFAALDRIIFERYQRDIDIRDAVIVQREISASARLHNADLKLYIHRLTMS